MAAATSGYPSRDAGPGLLHHQATGNGPSGPASTCAGSLGFAMANGSEDHCNVALAGLFQQIMNDMKGSTFIWEDFLAKSGRLHSALKSTLVASSAFLDAFQRVADVATNARGGTKEIGKCLTRMVLRQRSIEAKMKTFASALMDCLVTPLQEKMEDWKKTCLYMDKEHAKEYKKWRQEIKKRSTDTIRLQKKAKKGNGSSKAMEAWNDLVEMKRQLQEKEFEAVRQAMIEERSRLCLFVSCLKPFLDEELSMLSEMVHLEEITDALMQHSADPFQLPPASLQAILDVKATCSSTVSTTDILLQDHLANDTYYSSSCSSGSNQWGNYMSPPNSPLQEEPVSSRSSNQDDGIRFRDSSSTHPDTYSTMSARHGSICSISNASTSSYASSDVSLSSYGGINLQDKTLCPAPSASVAKPYRRCFSDNNGQEQHYYPSSIASSIVENDMESSGGEEGKGGNGELTAGSQRHRSSRPRRSSLSRSEDLHQDSLIRHHPLSLAVRNEYYSSIRFSSISSGDSGFISHPDQNSGGNHADSSQDAQDSLLTPTMQNGCVKGDKSTWSSPTSLSSSDSDNAALRRPPVPPFGSVLRDRRLELDGRPHTIAYNGGIHVMGPSRPDDAVSCRQVARNHKRPPLTQETFVPPPLPAAAGFQSMAQIVLPKEFRRSCNLDTHPQLKADETVVYANSDLLNDTSSLPPPPDCWIGQHDTTAPKPGDTYANDAKRIDDTQQVTVSMTIRRVKDKMEYFGEGPQAEAMRKQMLQDRQLRRHSQQIYGIPQSLSSRPPPPPLPIRRTPSLHQSICDTDADIPLNGAIYGQHVAPPPKSHDHHSVYNQPVMPPPKSHEQSRPPKTTENHANMINALQERLRQSAKPASQPIKQPVPIVQQSNGSTARSVNGPESAAAPPGGPPRMPVNGCVAAAPTADGRNGLFEQIRHGGFYLRKVNPDQRRDRSSPFIRK